MLSLSWYRTRFGTGAVLAGEAGICRVLLPFGDESDCPAMTDLIGLSPSAQTEHAAELLMRYFAGAPQHFESIAVDLGGVTPFRARILELIRRIPHGRTMSYAQVAAMAGQRGGARAIGGAMAANPVPIIIPCHRVVASDGRLTGYSAPGGTVSKKILLEMEGVEFKGVRARGKAGGY